MKTIVKNLIKGSFAEPFARELHKIVNSPKYSYAKGLETKTNILLACFPKSGSTYTAEVISKLPNFRKVHLAPTKGGREQELDIRYLVKNKRQNYVAQHHVRYHATTDDYIKQFKLHPIILVRNIFDVVISIKDHLRSKSNISPMAQIPKDLLTMNDNDFEIAITKLIIPWYFNFYVSWYNFPNKLMITYEEMLLNPSNFFSNIFNFCDIKCGKENLNSILDKISKDNIRFNKGIKGRGKNLNPIAKDYIRSFKRYYPKVNFSKIGL